MVSNPPNDFLANPFCKKNIQTTKLLFLDSLQKEKNELKMISLEKIQFNVINSVNYKIGWRTL